MIETLDYQKLDAACRRAMRRHCLSELEMVVLGMVIDLSFGIGEAYLRLDYAIEIARNTGLSKGKAHEVVRRLQRGRALEVSEDRCIYTPLPPSKAWPWIFAERVDPRLADELERGIVWAAKGEKQAEFFGPEAGQEFAEALTLERMRTSLIEFHHAATARFAGGLVFPVTDRLPTPAPAPGLSCGEERTRPLGTAKAGDDHSLAESFTPEQEGASGNAAPREPGDSQEQMADGKGSRIGNPVPESGTESSRIGNPPLKDFKAFKVSKRDVALLENFKGEFPNREPGRPLRAPDPSSTEDEMVEWLRPVLGTMACRACFEARRRKCECAHPQPALVMDVFGGWWRLKIRESRYAAVNVCAELALRMTDRSQKPLRNVGGWARDQYFRIRAEELEATEGKSTLKGN